MPSCVCVSAAAGAAIMAEGRCLIDAASVAMPRRECGAALIALGAASGAARSQRCALSPCGCACSADAPRGTRFPAAWEQWP